MRALLDTGQPILDQEIRIWTGRGDPDLARELLPGRVNAENIGIGVVLVDVTDQPHEADELRSTFMANMTESLSIAGSERRRTFRNPAAETILGWGEQELSGKFIEETIQHQEPDDAFTCKTAPAFQSPTRHAARRR